MRPLPSSAPSSPPRAFNYSLDWRFLLPLAPHRSTGLIFHQNEDFHQTLGQAELAEVRILTEADLQHPLPDRFQQIVLPFGVPHSWTGPRHQDRVTFFRFLTAGLEPGGHLLVGFNHRWNRGAAARAHYFASTPREMILTLRQAGFVSVKLYGAMPDLEIPEYLFHLEPSTIQFAFRNRFRRKPAILRSLDILARTIGWKQLSRYLPCYFALASA